ncbi:unnamed protein product, partial [Adineta steineri]
KPSQAKRNYGKAQRDLCKQDLQQCRGKEIQLKLLRERTEIEEKIAETLLQIADIALTLRIFAVVVNPLIEMILLAAKLLAVQLCRFALNNGRVALAKYQEVPQKLICDHEQ